MKMISKILIGCTILVCILQSQYTILGSTIKVKRSFSDNIQSGIKLAQKIFSGFDVDTSNNVADLVAKAFSTPNKLDFKKSDQPPPGTSMLSNLFQIIGLDSGKVGALAVNAIIFIAQMINKVLTVNSTYPSIKPSARSLEDITNKATSNTMNQQNTETNNKYNKKNQKQSEFLIDSPLAWILNRNTTQFSEQLVNGRDKSLPQYLAELIGSYEKIPGEADCMKILICKSAPFIWGMQNAINDRLADGSDDDDVENIIKTKENLSNKEFLYSFFKYLPEIKQFQYHGDGCEERYHQCKLFDI